MKQRPPLTPQLVLNAATEVLGSREALRLYGLAVLANRMYEQSPTRQQAIQELFRQYWSRPRDEEKELWRELRQVRAKVQCMTGQDTGPAIAVLDTLARAGLE